MNNKSIPSFERNDFICPKCNKLTKNESFEFIFSSNKHYPGAYYRKIKLIRNNSELIFNYEDNINYLEWEVLWKSIIKNSGMFYEQMNNNESLNIILKICTNCQNRLIYDASSNETNWNFSNSQNMTNFDIDQPNEYMPENLKIIYNEAKSISKLSPRASAALLRHILEQMLLEKFPNLKNEKLSSILTNENIISQLGKNLLKKGEAIRFVGNKTLHTLEINMDELNLNMDKMFKWVNEISSNLYDDDKEFIQAENLKNNIISKKQ